MAGRYAPVEREEVGSVLAGAETFVHDGSDDIGVLLCHGFTSSPQSLRPWGEHLASENITVRCPRLPGHGTNWQELNRTHWQDWYSRVQEEFGVLRDRCRSVFAFGLSMGGTLALRLAEQYGSDLAGLAVVNPSVTTLRRDAALAPVLSLLVPTVRGVAGDIAKPGARELAYDRTPLRAFASLRELWREVRADLGKVSQPLLILHSAVDHVVEPINTQIVLDGVRSDDVTDVLLRDSYHVATLDNDAPVIFERSMEFARRVHTERMKDLV
jgi:carboxylesterase